jgi:hypothetical protein
MFNLQMFKWIDEANPHGSAVLPDARVTGCGTSDGDLSGKRATGSMTP